MIRTLRPSMMGRARRELRWGGGRPTLLQAYGWLKGDLPDHDEVATWERSLPSRARRHHPMAARLCRPRLSTRWGKQCAPVHTVTGAPHRREGRMATGGQCGSIAVLAPSLVTQYVRCETKSRFGRCPVLGADRVLVSLCVLKSDCEAKRFSCCSRSRSLW